MIVLSRLPRVVLLLLLTVPASGGERPAAHPVALPAPETAARLERCLAASGFDVTRHETSGAEIRIEAMRGADVRALLVSPRSPLASVVEWGPNAGEPHAPGTPDDLRACIDRGGAPTEVLAGEKFVVCLRTRREGREILFSGLLVGSEGTIVSTAHDLDRVESVSVRLRDGRIVPGRIGEKGSLAGPDTDRSSGTGSRVSPRGEGAGPAHPGRAGFLPRVRRRRHGAPAGRPRGGEPPQIRRDAPLGGQDGDDPREQRRARVRRRGEPGRARQGKVSRDEGSGVPDPRRDDSRIPRQRETG